MENDVLDYLQCIGYDGPLTAKDVLLKSLETGLKDVTLRDCIVWICHEITVLTKIDETVSQISQDEEIANFVMEICSLLKELNCPYQKLTNGPVSERLSSSENLVKLLLFLTSELMAAKVISVEKPNAAPVLRIQETNTAKDLKNMLLTLQFSRPPDNISPKDLFQKVESKLKGVLTTAPPELISKPLLTGRLSKDQWETLKQVHEELQQEYQLRREMLLKRMDVTIQSFEWSERLRGKEDILAKEFVEKRRNLSYAPNVDLADVIAARQDLAIIEKTSSQAARKNTQSFVHKVLIGRVPDRGGRPSEQEAPPPEMPSWQKERAQGGGGGGGGGRGGGGGQFTRGSGRVQGGWNQRDDTGQRNDGYNDRGQRGQGQGREDRGDRRSSWNQHDDRTDRGNKSDYHDERGNGRRNEYRGGRGGGRGRGYN